MILRSVVVLALCVPAVVGHDSAVADFRRGAARHQSNAAAGELARIAADCIRAFHDAVLGSGSMPLSILEQHVHWFIGERQARSQER